MRRQTQTPYRIQWRQGVILLIGIYDVKIGEVTVGKAKVEKQGLYYRFVCRCRLSGDTMHRLEVSCGGKQWDLGICVPVNGYFCVDKKLPRKQFPGDKPVFRLVPKGGENRGKYVPVYPEEPFAYMAKLKNAYLEIRDGQAGLVISE